ncbi:hypothetical protein JR782_004605 [Salmonella enterica subsp. enterica serovar Eastbourne]|nr:hypothetical protein [Salmonella enterica subsp. enterica serovar Eastbourne]EHC5910016.1 hypothetical protein [Salmonella enterica subsp. enterica serovar Eastbourne]
MAIPMIWDIASVMSEWVRGCQQSDMQTNRIVRARGSDCGPARQVVTTEAEGRQQVAGLAGGV